MKIICAVDENWGIGFRGDLLFHFQKDLKRFQDLTMGHNIVMGRKTQQSLPGGQPLTGRNNMVLSRKIDYAPEGFEMVHKIEELPKDCFVIGGGEVYELLLSESDEIYLTKVKAKKQADTFFPNIDTMPEWKIVDVSKEYEEDGIMFSFVKYVKES